MTLQPSGNSGSFRGYLCAGIALAYVAAIFYVGSIPRALVRLDFSASDKLGHALAFGLMQWTHLATLDAFQLARPFAKLRWWSVLTATGAGALLELWQVLLPHRSAEGLDLLADFVGALLFSLLYFRPLWSKVSVASKAEVPSETLDLQ